MNTKRTAVLAGFCLVLALVLPALVGGCGDPYTMFQTSGQEMATGRKIMVMPFMDTRTFLAKNDPHKDDVGLYVRDIFTGVLRGRAEPAGAEVFAPAMEQPSRSMSTAEVAELGRRHGADVVIAGQVFSFNNTRAASIPPRAGMFVRVISAKTGALLFVGDHYSAATLPLVGGDRDDQALLVATKLVEGFLDQPDNGNKLAAAAGVASGNALANLAAEGTADIVEAAETEPAAEESEAPEPVVPAEPVVIVRNPIVPMRAEEVDELPELGVAAVNSTLASIDARAAISERLADISGDELAEDLLAADGNIFGDEAPAGVALPALPNANTATAASAIADTAADDLADAAEPEQFVASAPAGETAVALAPTVPPAPMSEVESAAEVLETEVLAVAAHASALDNGPVVSEPMVFEQPRTYRLTVDLPEDPSSALQDEHPLVASPAKRGESGAPRVLILPYHDRGNPNNLIASTGGGEVVTTLYGTQLALDPGITLMWDGTGMAAHDRLPSREEAIELGRLAGADYVMRGEVVEFRRAQSVPSFYSAMISTAVLAAQVFFAEMSGVDVATEVYRVSDGLCVMSRRDRSQQKYVVQAEKTVRRLAAGMAQSVSQVVREETPEEMDPLIDEIEP